MSRIVLIVAMGENRVIGAGNGLPWRIPSDMKRFRALTLGKPVVMGRKTWETIGAPLGERDNIVVTRQAGFAPEGVLVAHDLDGALAMAERCARARGRDEIAVIGGAEIYAAVLPRADRIEMTVVKGEVSGDTCFPEIDPGEWNEVSRQDAPRGEKDSHATSYVVLERRAPAGQARAGNPG